MRSGVFRLTLVALLDFDLRRLRLLDFDLFRLFDRFFGRLFERLLDFFRLFDRDFCFRDLHLDFERLLDLLRDFFCDRDPGDCDRFLRNMLVFFVCDFDRDFDRDCDLDRDLELLLLDDRDPDCDLDLERPFRERDLDLERDFRDPDRDLLRDRDFDPLRDLDLLRDFDPRAAFLAFSSADNLRRNDHDRIKRPLVGDCSGDLDGDRSNLLSEEYDLDREREYDRDLDRERDCDFRSSLLLVIAVPIVIDTGGCPG